MTYMLLAYGIVAAVLLVVGLASTPPPRSAVLITVAALVWPLTMGAITLHAYVLEPLWDRWVDPHGHNEGSTTARGSVRPQYSLQASNPSGPQVL